MSDSEKIRKVVFSRNLPNGEVYYYEEEFLTEPGSRGETSLGDRLIAMSTAGSDEIVATCTYRGVPRGGLLKKIPAENNNGYQLVGDMTSVPAGTGSGRFSPSPGITPVSRTRAGSGRSASAAGGSSTASGAANSAAAALRPGDNAGERQGGAAGSAPSATGAVARGGAVSAAQRAERAARRAAADLDAWSRTDESAWKEDAHEERRPWYYDDDEPMEEDEFDARAIYRSNRSSQSPLGADLRGGAHFFRSPAGQARDGQWGQQQSPQESISHNSYTQGNGPMNGTKHNNTQTPADQAARKSNGAERTSAQYNRYVSGRYERTPVNSQVVFKDFYTPRDSANASFISARQINPTPARIRTVPASSRAAARAEAAYGASQHGTFSQSTAISGNTGVYSSAAGAVADLQTVPAAPARQRQTDIHPHGYLQDQGHFPIRGVCGIRGHVDAGTGSAAERRRDAMDNLMVPDSRGALPVDENYRPSESAKVFAFQYSSQRQAYSHAKSVSRYSYGAEYAGWQRSESGLKQPDSAAQIAALKSSEVKQGHVKVTTPADFAAGKAPSQWWRDQKLTERSAQKAFAAEHFKQNTRGSYIGTPDEFIPKNDDDSMRRSARTVYSADQLRGSEATVIMGGRDEADRQMQAQAAAQAEHDAQQAARAAQEQERLAREQELRARAEQEERARREEQARREAEHQREAEQARLAAQEQASTEAAEAAQREAEEAAAAAQAAAQSEKDKGPSTAVARSELKLAPVDPSFADFKTADGSRATMVEDVPKAVTGNDVTHPGMNVNSSDSTAITSSSAALKDAFEADTHEEDENLQSTTISGTSQEAPARAETPAPASYSFGDFKTADGSLADATYRVPVMSQKQLQAQRELEARQKAEQERLEAERREAERLEAERKAEEERKAAEKAEQERLEAERKAEQERLEAERKAEEERKAAEKAEQERLEAERKAEEERKAAEKAEQERLEAERKAEEERKAAEKAEQERLEAERKAAEKAEQERLEAERKAEEERKAAEKAEQERLEAERREAERKAEEERKAAEKAEQERLEAERKAEEERKAAEKAEQERLEAERKAEEERKAAEKAEQERLEAERKAEEERLAAEKAELERLEAEQAELEAVRKAEQEREAAERAERAAAAAAAAAAGAADGDAGDSAQSAAPAAGSDAQSKADGAQGEQPKAMTKSQARRARQRAKAQARAAAARAAAEAAQAQKDRAQAVSGAVSSDNASAAAAGAAVAGVAAGATAAGAAVAAASEAQTVTDDKVNSTAISGDVSVNPDTSTFFGSTEDTGAFEQDLVIKAEYSHQSLDELAATIKGESENHPLAYRESTQVDAMGSAYRPADSDTAAIVAQATTEAGDEHSADQSATEEVEPSVDAASLVSGAALPDDDERQEPGLSTLPAIDNLELEQEPQLNLDSSVVDVDREPSLKDVARVENVQDEEEPVFKDNEAMGSVIDAVSGESITERDLIFATPTRFVENEGSAEDSRQAMIAEAAQSGGSGAETAGGVKDHARAAQNAIADAVADSLESEDLLADSFMSDDSGLEYLHTSSDNEGSTARGSSSLANLAAELVDDFDDPFEDSFASSLDEDR